MLRTQNTFNTMKQSLRATSSPQQTQRVVFVPDTVQQLYQDQDTLRNQLAQIQQNLEDVARRIPMELQQQADSLLQSLSEETLAKVLDVVVCRCALKVPFGPEEVLQDLQSGEQVEVNRDLKDTLQRLAAQFFEEDCFIRLQSTYLKAAKDQATDVEALNTFIQQREAALDGISAGSALRISSKDRLQKLNTLLQQSADRLNIVKQCAEDLQQIFCPPEHLKQLEALAVFFRSLCQEASISLLETVVDARSAQQFFQGLQRARNVLLCVYGINYGIASTAEERFQVAQVAAKYSKYSDTAAGPIAKLIGEFSVLIRENAEKISDDRARQIQLAIKKVDDLQQTLADQILYCQERLQIITRAEDAAVEILQQSKQLLEKQNQLKKVNYELGKMKQLIQSIDDELGTELLNKAIVDEKDKQKQQKILLDEENLCKQQINGLVDAIEGLSQTELLELLLDRSSNADEAKRAFNVVTNPQ